MNADKAKTIIATIVTETQRKYRKQYASAVWQDTKLKELGIFDLMPKGFRHSDADAVLKAAQQGEGYTGGFDAYGEGYDVKNPAHPLYQALNEVVEPDTDPSPTLIDSTTSASTDSSDRAETSVEIPKANKYDGTKWYWIEPTSEGNTVTIEWSDTETGERDRVQIGQFKGEYFIREAPDRVAKPYSSTVFDFVGDLRQRGYRASSVLGTHDLLYRFNDIDSLTAAIDRGFISLDVDQDKPLAELDYVLTAAEAAQLHGLSESAVRKAIERNQIPARKAGKGTWLVRKVDADAKWGKHD